MPIVGSGKKIESIQKMLFDEFSCCKYGWFLAGIIVYYIQYAKILKMSIINNKCVEIYYYYLL